MDVTIAGANNVLINVNAFVNANLHNCDDNASCSNVSGRFECECINEHNKCGDNSECLNTDGSYVCLCSFECNGESYECNCINGYVKTGSDCADVGECNNVNIARA